MDWANGSLSPAHRPVLMGLVRTPADKRDPAAIAAGIAACEALFAILDAELATSPGYPERPLASAISPWRRSFIT
jgi:glutathione S-transferase